MVRVDGLTGQQGFGSLLEPRSRRITMRTHIPKLAAVALLGGLIAGLLVSGGAPSGQGSAMTGRGDVRTLRAGYERWKTAYRSEEHTSELQSPYDLVCRLLL